MLIKSLRSINLLNNTVFHNNDSVAHCHSFSLIVSYVNKCCTQFLVKLSNFCSHLCTELSVKVWERFVKQEYLRWTNDSTTQSNTLTLTAWHSLRLSVEKVTQVEDLSGFLNLTVDFVLWNFSQLKTKSHVIINSHMRIQSVVLENHCDISVLRSDIVYKTVAYIEFTFRDFFQTGNHSERCGLTAAGRSD